MNSCGFEILLILRDFIDDTSESNIKNYMKYYSFDKWYPQIENIIDTPKSYIFEINDLYNGNINKLIKKLPNQECFARLDCLSSKPIFSYKSSDEIISDLYFNNRTSDQIGVDTKIIIREWIYNITNEFRCFVCNGKLRGISCSFKRKLLIEHIANITEMINKIVKITDNDDCTVDFGFVNEKIILIEINSPVYLAATSGYFDLSIPFDYEVLLGDYIPEIINYPVIRDESLLF